MKRKCTVYVDGNTRDGEIQLSKKKLVLVYGKEPSNINALLFWVLVIGAFVAWFYKEEAGGTAHTIGVSMLAFSFGCYVVTIFIPPLKRLLTSCSRVDLANCALCADPVATTSTGVSSGRVAAKVAASAMAGAMFSAGKTTGAGMYAGLARFLPISKTVTANALLLTLDDGRVLMIEATAKTLDLVRSRIVEIPKSLRGEYLRRLADLRRNPEGPGRAE
ncbi:MAG: hypothetical protein V7772_06105 [Pseudomonas profundi]|uniref:hypothetical protein n=1 Tax=Pseudomonas profundi TaxID=1981513 RepID=UPI003002D693